ncbi:SIMPL domain-containing protein [Microbacterium sp. YY-01]|uniref:SIMPL domain-containing protein n=1 Tax=Microbacterium sp. YY-01 TaxID=3421634 RepID=UPI003D180F66
MTKEVIITVRGEHETRHAPERATVHLAVRSEHHERADAVARAHNWAAPVIDSLQQRENTEGFERWSSSHVTVRAERPWNNEGKRLPVVYTATVEFTVVFRDATELSTWISEVSVRDGITIYSVQWSLTETTREEVEREVATRSVAVAIVRAEAYARALGLTTVTAQEIADTGLLSRNEPRHEPRMMSARASAVGASTAPQFELEPEDIIVSATVEARFIAQ